jgi:hypothetical protein
MIFGAWGQTSGRNSSLAQKRIMILLPYVCDRYTGILHKKHHIPAQEIIPSTLHFMK